MTSRRTQRASALRPLAALLVLGSSATAAAQAPSPAQVPALLVLSTANAPTSRAMEQRYVGELGLALEGVAVRALEPEAPTFAARPLAEQIELVRALLERHRGLAATWLTPMSSELVLVHMVVLTSGRVLVRMIEGNPSRPGFATDLAMASRELLGTAFLFAPPPPETPVARVVETVRARAASPTAQRGASPSWSLALRARSGGGVAGFDGPSILMGAELSVARTVTENPRVRALLDARGGPLNAGRPTLPVQMTLFAAGLGASYLWRLGPLRLGPSIELRATWTTLQVQSTPTTSQTFSLFSARADVGPDARVAIGDRIELIASAALTVSPLRKVLTLASSGETLISTPFLGWETSLGAAVRLF